jgi:hypothetical protein
VQKVCAGCGGTFEAKRATAKACSERCKKRAQRAKHTPEGGRAGEGRPPARGGANPGPDDRQPGRWEPGPVEKQVRADVDALVTAHPMGESLAEMSFSLARALDLGMGGMAAAAVNRELRENLTELAKLADNDDDELADELSEPELPS